MKILITAGPVLDTVSDDPEARATLASRATENFKTRGQEREVKVEEIPLQWVNTHSVRYEHGQVYEVDAETGGRLRGHGWAVVAPEDAKVPRGKPFDSRDATDEHAEEWDAQAQDRVQAANVRSAGGPTGTDLDVQDVRTDSGASF